MTTLGDEDYPDSHEDFHLLARQLDELIHYYTWTCNRHARLLIFASAPVLGQEVDEVLSVAELRELRQSCEDDQEDIPTLELHQSTAPKVGLSDEELQNLVRFYRWRSSLITFAQEPDRKFGLLYALQSASWYVIGQRGM